MRPAAWEDSADAGSGPWPAPMSSQGLATVADIRRLLEVAVIDTLSLENSVARTRTLAYLAQTALKCLEVGELEDRLALLEAAVRSQQFTTTRTSTSTLTSKKDPTPRS